MEPSSELRDLFVRLYDAIAKGDVAFIEQHFSDADELRAIGTDVEEWWSGQRVPEVFKEQIEAMGGSMPLKPGDPEAYVEGSVGWVADRGTLTLPDGGSLPVRVTAVAHREDGDWRLVQWHASLGVPNEETVGELPT